MKRLGRDHFIALRSLDGGRWLQGQQFMWKFNREWRSVSFDEVPALDAVDRLIELGLAEQVVCCSECKRESFRLTEAGRAMVIRMNARPGERIDNAVVEPTKAPTSRGWFKQLIQVIAPRLQS